MKKNILFFAITINSLVAFSQSNNKEKPLPVEATTLPVNQGYDNNNRKLLKQETEPAIIKTATGFEFKNITFSSRDKEALLKIYSGKETSFRIVSIKDGEQYESYGKADIRKVSILSSSNAETNENKVTWIFNKTSKENKRSESWIRSELTALSADESTAVSKILFKYARR